MDNMEVARPTFDLTPYRAVVSSFQNRLVRREGDEPYQRRVNQFLLTAAVSGGANVQAENFQPSIGILFGLALKTIPPNLLGEKERQRLLALAQKVDRPGVTNGDLIRELGLDDTTSDASKLEQLLLSRLGDQEGTALAMNALGG